MDIMPASPPMIIQWITGFSLYFWMLHIFYHRPVWMSYRHVPACRNFWRSPDDFCSIFFKKSFELIERINKKRSLCVSEWFQSLFRASYKQNSTYLSQFHACLRDFKTHSHRSFEEFLVEFESGIKVGYIEAGEDLKYFHITNTFNVV